MSGIAVNVGLFTSLSGASVGSGVDAVLTSGWGAIGVGEAFYSRVLPASVAGLPAEGAGIWWVTTADGHTYQLDEEAPNLYQYGAVAGGNVNAILPIAHRHVERTDSTLVVPSARFVFDGSLGGATTSRTRIRGTRPSFSVDDSALQYGSILQGSLWIKSPFVDVRGLGVDHGSAWFTSTTDAFKISPYNDATSTSIPGTYLHVEGVAGLGYDGSPGYHSLLIENFSDGFVQDIEGCKNNFAIALKLNSSTVQMARGRKAGSAGRNIIIKSDAQFGGQGQCFYSDLTSEGTGSTNSGVSFLAEGNTQMDSIVIRGIRSFGCVHPLIFEAETGSKISDISIEDAIITGEGGNINDAAFTTNGNVYNVKITNSIVRASLTQRAFTLGGGKTVDFSNVEMVVPIGGLVADAGYVGATEATFWNNVRISQASDYGVPCTVTFDNVAGVNRADNLCIFNATGTNPLRRIGLTATAVPTSGRYVTGEFVGNTAMSPVSNNMVVLGWYRMTSGTGHTLNIDWRVIYASTVSLAA